MGIAGEARGHLSSLADPGTVRRPWAKSCHPKIHWSSQRSTYTLTMSEQTLQTEFEFTLPRGYVDGEGTLHKEGTMRLANAADEIEPLQDPRVQSNSSYLTIILLARVVTELGTLDSINTNVIESLFVKDLEYLQDLYARINHQGANTVGTACPDCGHEFEVDASTGAVASSEPAPDSTRAEIPTSSPVPEDEPGNPAE